MNIKISNSTYRFFDKLKNTLKLDFLSVFYVKLVLIIRYILSIKTPHVHWDFNKNIVTHNRFFK